MPDGWIEGFLASREPREKLARVRAPAWNEPVVACLLADTVWVRFLHYDVTVNRTVPCLGKEDCAYCPDPTIRAVGFVAALEGQQRKQIVSQFSDSALDDLNEIVRVQGFMRGLVVQTERADKRNCARMAARLLSVVPADVLPAEFDPRPSLEKMWGWSLRHVAAQRLGGEQQAERPRRRRT